MSKKRIGWIATIIVVGITLYGLIRLIQEYQYNKTINEQVENLFMPVLNNTKVIINEEKYVFEYRSNSFINDKIIRFKDIESVFIQFDMYKESVEPSNFVAECHYIPYVERKGLNSPIQIVNRKGNYNIPMFINAVNSKWLEKWLDKKGEIITQGISSSYNMDAVTYNNRGILEHGGQITGRGELEGTIKEFEHKQEKEYKGSWMTNFFMEEGVDDLDIMTKINMLE